MRYDEYNSAIKRNGTKYNSGYESAGFESFDRDDCMCFAEAACVNNVDINTAAIDARDRGWSFVPQGTSSISYVNDDGKISTLTSSIAALNSCVETAKAGVDSIGKALNAVSKGLRKKSHWSDKLDLKNQFRGGKLRRCQLQTLQKGTFEKMNKEQFKKSISNLVNYYINNMVQLNASVAGKSAEDMKDIVLIAENQAKVLSQTFNYSLDKLVNEFCEEESEDEADEQSALFFWFSVDRMDDQSNMVVLRGEDKDGFNYIYFNLDGKLYRFGSIYRMCQLEGWVGY